MTLKEKVLEMGVDGIVFPMIKDFEHIIRGAKETLKVLSSVQGGIS